MAQIRDFEAEALSAVRDAVRNAEGDVQAAFGRVFHHDQPQPSFTPAESAAPSQPEVHPMSLGTEIHRVAQVVEVFGEDGLAIFEAVAGNPETRAALIVLARLAGIPLTSGTITAGMGTLAALENVWHTAQAALSQPQQQAPANGTGAHAAQPGTPQVI